MGHSARRQRGSDQESWEATLAKARLGDSQARDRIIVGAAEDLRRGAGRMLPAKLRRRASGSDLAQDTCVEMTRIFEQFRGGTREEFRAWARTILVHKVGRLRASDKERGDGRPPGRSSSAAPAGPNAVDPHPTPAGKARREERFRAMAQAIAGLPELQRDVFLLHYRDGLPFRAIGERLGYTERWTWQQWKTGVESLRRRLGPGHEPS